MPLPRPRRAAQRLRGLAEGADEGAAHPSWDIPAPRTMTFMASSGIPRYGQREPDPHGARRLSLPSFGFDVGVLDDLLVLRHLVLDVFGEIVRRGADRFEAKHPEPFLDVRPLDDFRHLALNLRHQIGGKTFRRPQAVPRSEIEALHAGFGDGGNFGRDRHALGAGD